MNLIDYQDSDISSLWNDYAETRNNGLKKIANAKLKKLVEYLDTKTKEDKRRFVDYLCIERFEKGSIKDFQQPIVEGIILPVIVEAVEHEEMPHLRWIYQLQLYSCCNYKNIENIEYYNSEDILIHANGIDPSDIKTINLLLELYVDGLWFGSHHLPEYILINEKEVNVLINKVNHLIEKYESRIENKRSTLEDIKYYNDLYKSWFKYKSENRNISFLEWCKDNEKNYFWVKAYYYDKRNRT